MVSYADGVPIGSQALLALGGATCLVAHAVHVLIHSWLDICVITMGMDATGGTRPDLWCGHLHLSTCYFLSSGCYVP